MDDLIHMPWTHMPDPDARSDARPTWTTWNMDDGIIDSEISGGGCAIAAGSDNTPRGNAFNLLLIVSALLFTVSFGSRAVGRRNDIGS